MIPVSNVQAAKMAKAENKEPMQQFISFRPVCYDLSTRLNAYSVAAQSWNDPDQMVPATQAQRQAMRLLQQVQTQRSQFESSQQVAIRVNERQMVTSTLASNPQNANVVTTTTTTELNCIVESSQLGGNHQLVQRRKLKRRMFMQIGLSKKQRVKNSLHSTLSLN